MEVHLPRIVAELRKVDALLYYDGANMVLFTPLVFRRGGRSR